MKRSWIIAAAAWSALAAGSAGAQERGLFTVSALGGLTGAFDSKGERTFDHSALQLGFGVLTDDLTWTTLRVGRLDLDDEEIASGRSSTEIEFATIAGEYRFRQAAYDFGIFVGVGGYRLDADLLVGGQEREEAVGITAGLAGDFDFSPRLSFIAEIDFHYVFFDETNSYGSALAGLAVHF